MVGAIAETRNPHPRTTSQFEACYAELFEPILRYATRRLGRSVGEDICAQTFTEVWRHWDRFDPGRGSRRAWVFGIATNLIREHCQSEERRLRAWATFGRRPEGDDPADIAVDRADADARFVAVAAALVDLRDVDRELLWLRATAGLTYAELAQITGVEVGTVRSRLSRAKRRVRDQVIAAQNDTPASLLERQ